METRVRMLKIKALEKVILKICIIENQFQEYKSILGETNKEINLLRRQGKWEVYPIEIMELTKFDKQNPV